MTMSDKNNNLTSGGRIVFGLIFILFGIFPMLATFDIGPLGVKDINGPPWLGFSAGGVFIAGGLAIMLPKPPFPQLMGFLIIAGLAAIGNWIAFGVGERVCSSNLDLFGFIDNNEHSGLACRIPFGLGAVIMDAILIYIAVSTLQKMLGGPPKLQRTRKVAEWAIWISLTPILFPLILFLLARAGIDALKTRIQTGAWPRNQEFIDRQKRTGLLKSRFEKKIKQRKHSES